MKDNELVVSDISETSYVLDKLIWEQYNMKETKENVVSFFRNYKEAKTRSIQSVLFSSYGLTTSYSENKVTSRSRVNNNGFANSVNLQIDAEQTIKTIEPIIEILVKTFTVKEKIYYDYCLVNNNSEEYLREVIFSGLSKHGLLPIKNSCILKIAMAFNLEIKK